MKLRYTLLPLTLDIEHHIKIRLLNIIEENNEDGWEICKDYKDFLSEDQQMKLADELKKNIKSEYERDLVEKYKEDYPVWVFLELISFGTLQNFVLFCSRRFDNYELKNDYYTLFPCRSIRNASAHSNCIINNLYPNTQKYKPKRFIKHELAKIDKSILTPDARSTRMTNERIQHIISVLYAHKKFITSEGMHRKAAENLQLLSQRMFKNMDYYENNELIKSNFKFIKIVIDNWFSMQ